MTNPATYPGPPVELPLRLEADPAPAPYCDVCGALDQQRREARAEGNLSAVSDANVEIRDHPHNTRWQRS
ncbi:hypothetical protein AB0G73_30405 [Streptomyces sp. NPDC020719]|uniref:hypothetical protein n=1 Tax=Streptomyces sp. NPDC020719 TaxID=3154896 RepID=UPI0033D4894C